MDLFVRILNPLLMAVLGVGVGVLIARRYQQPWRLYLIGATTFILSQVLHLPFNSLVLNRIISDLGLAGASQGAPLLAVYLLLGLSAGLFEETFRWLTYRFWARQARHWRQGLMVGAGHGGVEAILVAVLAGATLVQILALQGVDLATVLPPEQVPLAQAQMDAFWAASPAEILLGALERLFAICFHLSLSLLVLRAITRRSPLWYLAAVGWHTLINAVGLYALQLWGPYGAEGILGLGALISLGIIWALREPPPEDDAPQPEPLPPPLTGDELARQTPTGPQAGSLDDSRYSD